MGLRGPGERPAELIRPAGRFVPAGLAGVAGLAVLCVAVAAAFGFDYAIGNQPTYLLDGLRDADPRLLANDWLASRTWAYHPAFSWVVRAAAATGSMPWVLAVVHVVVVAATLLGVAWMARRLVGGSSWLPAILLLGLALVDRTSSIAGSYVFADSLQPSTLAAAAFVGAIGAFLCRRWLWSGVALAVAGVFHVNFLVLGIGAFALAHLLLGARGLARRGAAQLALPLLVLALDLPVLLEVSAAPGAAEAARVFMLVRAPHHYVPRTFLGDVPPFLLWQVAAMALLADARFEPRTRRRVGALWASFAVPVIVATAVNTVGFVPQVSQLFFWRLAPFAVLLAQGVIAVALTRPLVAPEAAHRSPGGSPGGWTTPARRAIAAAAIAVLAGAPLARDLVASGSFGLESLVRGAVIGALLGVPALASLVAARTGGATARRAATACCILVLGAFTLRTGAAVYRESTLLHGERLLPEAGLYGWARTTPLDAVFVVPPELEAFRLRARRAIVVDWKSTPVLPAEMLEWHRRIEEVAGGPVRSYRDAVAGYRQMDGSRLARLRDSYGARFAVLRAADTGAVAAAEARFPTVYDDGVFRVVSLAPLVAPGGE